MQTMQTSEFLYLLGHSSGSAVSWDVFRGGWHRTVFSGILLWRGVLSQARVGVFSVFSVFLPAFKYLPGRPFRIDLFDIAHFLNFNEISFPLPDVTYGSLFAILMFVTLICFGIMRLILKTLNCIKGSPFNFLYFAT